MQNISKAITAGLFLLASLGFSQTDSFMNQGAMRSFIVHAPAGASNPALVINMHGMGSNASQQVLLSGFNTIADREKFIVVYPNGIGNQWDLAGNRDVNFISALIDTMSARYRIDPRRVFATGMSMGGYMSHRLGCMLSGRIAAIGPVAGLNATYNCAPSRAVPVLQIHGTADSVVKYSGVAATMSGWVTRNGCPATAVTVDPYPATNANSVVKKDTWGPCRDSSEVVLLTVEGDGHTWPGAAWGGATRDINASEEIWTFFKKHPMPGGAGVIDHGYYSEKNNTPFMRGGPARIELISLDGKIIRSAESSDAPASVLASFRAGRGLYLLRASAPRGVALCRVAVW
jgi:poly(3-hydroxybutyrate) depolymerase